MQKCKDLMRKYIIKGSTIVVSCSGGPDSMCLLKNTIDLKEELDLNIVVAHINHNVREESDDEEKMLREYVKNNHLTFECLKIKNYSNENFHNEARIIRYDFMKKLIKKYDAKYLLTAHHGDDLMETIFMRIARGSNLKGYSGFQMIVDKGYYTVVRPLINNTKEEIIKYDDENNIPYALDKTNYLDDYTRNRYRNHVLPFLKTEDEKIHLKYIEFSNKINDAVSYLDTKVTEIVNYAYKDEMLNIKDFNQVDDYLKRVVIEKIIANIYGDDLYLVGDKNIDEILKLTSKNGNGEIHLPKNYVAIKEYNYLRIKEQVIYNNYKEVLNDKLSILNQGDLFITSEIGNSNYYLKLNSKEIKLPLIVRNKKDGDFIEVKNLDGKQKIKKIFIDYKVPRDKRETWPIVCDSNNDILWVPGLKKSKFDKSNEELYDIIIKYEEAKNE